MARDGKTSTRAVTTIIPARNGIVPLKMVPNGTSGATPLMMNTLIPTGGVITPMSVTKTIMTPNQIGSKPNLVTRGKRMGTVNIIKASESIKHPAIMYITIISPITAMAGIGRLPTKSETKKGIRVTAIK